MNKIKLLFGTSNQNKIYEFQEKVDSSIEIIDMKSVGIETDLRETKNTIEGNARQKVNQLQQLYDGNCFSEDTVLCVPSLNGKPGVNSARYAGEEKNDEKNIVKLLHEINGKDRSAYFLTVIALSWKNNIYTFEGRCEGTILKSKHGEGGFGYDPIFRPRNETESFAEMSMERKNKISHRAKAVESFVDFLNKEISNHKNSKN